MSDGSPQQAEVRDERSSAAPADLESEGDGLNTPMHGVERPADVRSMYGPTGWARSYRIAVMVTDAIVLTLVMVAAHALWFEYQLDVTVSGANAPSYVLLTPLIGGLWFALLVGLRSADPRVLGHGSQEFTRVLAASWYVFAVTAIAGFLLKWDISRGYLLIALGMGTLALLVYRSVWRFVVHRRRDAGELQARLIVVGTPVTARPLVNRLNANPRAGYSVVGIAMPPGTETNAESVLGVPVVGALDDPVAVARSVNAEYIALAGSDAFDLATTRRLGWDLEGTGIGLIVSPGVVDVAGPRVITSPVEGLPLLHINEAQFSGIKVAIKWMFDKIGALVALAILAIPMAIVALIVKLTSPGPVLFRQQRIGLNAEPFTMYKFRSMYVDAEERLHELLEQNEGNGVHFKMKDDPRVTPIGKFIRRFSIDEFPQLFNVLNGTMSMVGPRPPLPREVEEWDDRVMRRQLVRPGLTGLWQVSGRSDLSWEMAVRLDLYYTENWSLLGDILILARTVIAIISPKGAY